MTQQICYLEVLNAAVSSRERKKKVNFSTTEVSSHFIETPWCWHQYIVCWFSLSSEVLFLWKCKPAPFQQHLSARKTEYLWRFHRQKYGTENNRYLPTMLRAIVESCIGTDIPEKAAVWLIKHFPKEKCGMVFLDACPWLPFFWRIQLMFLQKLLATGFRWLGFPRTTWKDNQPLGMPKAVTKGMKPPATNTKLLLFSWGVCSCCQQWQRESPLPKSFRGQSQHLTQCLDLIHDRCVICCSAYVETASRSYLQDGSVLFSQHYHTRLGMGSTGRLQEIWVTGMQAPERGFSPQSPFED